MNECMTDACHIWNVTISPIGPGQRPRQSSWKDIVWLFKVPERWRHDSGVASTHTQICFSALHIYIRISLRTMVPYVSCFYLKSSNIMFSLFFDSPKKCRFSPKPFLNFPWSNFCTGRLQNSHLRVRDQPWNEKTQERGKNVGFLNK